MKFRADTQCRCDECDEIVAPSEEHLCGKEKDKADRIREIENLQDLLGEVACYHEQYAYYDHVSVEQSRKDEEKLAQGRWFLDRLLYELEEEE